MTNSESLSDVLKEIAQTIQITRPLTVLDVETTGKNTRRDRVVQFAAWTVTREGKVTKTKLYINPEMPIPKDVIKIHGITDSMVKDKRTFQEVAGKLAESLIGHDFVAYNSTFDQAILTAEFERASIASPFEGAAWVDPLKIWHHLEPRQLPDAVERFYGARPDETKAHDADADVDSAARALVGQLRKHSGTGDLPSSLEELTKITKPPDWLDAEGKIRWTDSAPRLSFGKHAGTPLQELVAYDPSYLEWILEKDFGADVKTIITNALNRKFPEGPSR